MKKTMFTVLLVMLFAVNSFAQINFTWDSDRGRITDTGVTTTQLTNETDNDTTNTFKLLNPEKWTSAYINIFIKSADADSCAIAPTLQGGWEDDWDGSNFTAVDGPDTVTTANGAVNEVQFTVTAADKAYKYWRIIFDGCQGQTKEANTTTLDFMITYDWDN